MGLLRFLTRFVGLCLHTHRYREVREGTLTLVCDVCGHAVPAIARGAGWVTSGRIEAKAVLMPKAAKSAKVTHMRRAK